MFRTEDQSKVQVEYDEQIALFVGSADNLVCTSTRALFKLKLKVALTTYPAGLSSKVVQCQSKYGNRKK